MRDSSNRSLGPGELQRTLELSLVVLSDRLINTGFLAESKPMLQRSIRVPSFSALAGTVLILISAAAQDFRALALLLWPIPTPHSIQDLARVWTSMPELRIDQRTPYACRSTIRRAGCEEMIPACSPLMKIFSRFARRISSRDSSLSGRELTMIRWLQTFAASSSLATRRVREVRSMPATTTI